MKTSNNKEKSKKQKTKKSTKMEKGSGDGNGGGKGRGKFQKRNVSQWEPKKDYKNNSSSNNNSGSNSDWKNKWTDEEWKEYYKKKDESSTTTGRPGSSNDGAAASSTSTSTTAAANPTSTLATSGTTSCGTTASTKNDTTVTEVHLRGHCYRVRVLSDLQVQLMLDDAQYETKLNTDYNSRTWTKSSAANLREAYTNNKLFVYKKAETGNQFLPLDLEKLPHIYPIAILAPVLIYLSFPLL